MNEKSECKMKDGEGEGVEKDVKEGRCNDGVVVLLMIAQGDDWITQSTVRVYRSCDYRLWVDWCLLPISTIKKLPLFCNLN